MREIEKERKRIKIEMGRLWGPLDWWPTRIVVMELMVHWARERVKTERKKGRKNERKNEVVRWVGGTARWPGG